MFSSLLFILAGSEAHAVGVDTLSVGDLVISEIMNNPSAVPYYRGQWIEIYNNSGQEVDLQNLVVDDGSGQTFTVSSSVVVGIGGYAVLGVRDNNAINGGVTLNYEYSVSSFAMTAGSFTINLSHNVTTFDSVSYDNGATFPDPTGATMSVDPAALDATSNDTGSNWCEAESTYGDGDYGTPGAVNDGCPVAISTLSAGDLLVTEVMHNPSMVDHYKGEWIEIYNNSTSYVDLINLEVTDSGTDIFVIDENIAVRPGEYVVLAVRDNELINGGIEGVDFRYLFGTEMTLDATDDIILSFDAVTFDTVSWDSISFPATLGVAMELGTPSFDATSNDTGSNWCDATIAYGDGDYGTPGEANGDCNLDTDSDGYNEDVDCDDNNAAINPGATEVCNDIDDDCNDLVDDSPSDGTTYYADVDEDFYGDPASSTDACSKPEGYRTNNLDCDDNDAGVTGADIWYQDSDSDTYGNPAATSSSCTQPGGYVADGTDCNDTTATINPGAAETCNGTDNNCSGNENDASDATTYYADGDSDFYGDPASPYPACSKPNGYRTNNLDCDDTNAGVLGPDTWYADSDSDTYGDLDTTTDACSQPSGYVADTTDCDDTSAAVNPGEAETCDGTDNNCSGDELDASDVNTYYADVDVDFYGDPLSTAEACTRPTGYRTNNLDCDDTSATVNPGEAETCDGTDNNCSGDETDASDATTWFADSDTDTYGDSGVSTPACTQPGGYVADSTDCNDASATVNPGEAETCDGTDNNCSGDETDASDATTWYADSDTDTYGNAASSTPDCSQPSGYVADATDCDDTNVAINPGETETCNGTDNNCSGDELDAVDVTTWYADADTDAYGDSLTTQAVCTQPVGYVADSTDCDDTNGAINPGESETCNGTDNNCSGDELDASDISTWYADSDTDTYGDSLTTQDLCTQPGGYVADATDCDDTNIAINPGETETCNGTDNNCSGDELDAVDVTTFYADSDTDTYGDSLTTSAACSQPGGYVADATDCDDTNIAINPGETETCNGTDNNCSGDELDAVDITTWYADSDTDTYGDSLTTQNTCTQPVGYVADATDCDDAAGTTYPGAAETCMDTVDSDCDGADSTAVCDGSLSNAFATFSGAVAGDRLGAGVSIAGDVNNDGYADIVVAAPYEDTAGTDAGRSYLFLGPASGSLSTGSADAVFTGATGEYSGLALSGAGDLNGDTYDDFIIGALGMTSNTGGAYIIHGPVSGSVTLSSGADATLTGETLGDYAGYAVSVVGDVDGDTYADILIGAYSNDGASANAGAAYLLHGPVTSVALGSADAIFTGQSTGERAGYATAGAGDVNGDGKHDMIIGAYRADVSSFTRAGRSYIIYGATSISGTASLSTADVALSSNVALEQAGSIVSSAGDVNNDGYDDVLIGAQHADPSGQTDAGRVYLVHGGASMSAAITISSSADATFTGEAASDFAGRSLATAYDLNADSHDDIVIGAKRNDGNGTDSGAAYVFLGPITGTVGLGTADALLTGAAAGQEAGIAVSAGGDVSGDGSPDIIVGAYKDTSEAGAAYLILGDTFR